MILLVPTFEFWRLEGGSLVTCYSGTKVRFTEKNIGRPLTGQCQWGGGLRDNDKLAANWGKS